MQEVRLVEDSFHRRSKGFLKAASTQVNKMLAANRQAHFGKQRRNEAYSFVLCARSNFSDMIYLRLLNPS